MNRKGETLPNPNDKRTRSEKQTALKKESKSRWFNPFWKSKSRQYIEWKIKEFESRGNENKARIYRSKL